MPALGSATPKPHRPPSHQSEHDGTRCVSLKMNILRTCLSFSIHGLSTTRSVNRAQLAFSILTFCVFALHATYRILPRPSSASEPRHRSPPVLKVFTGLRSLPKGTSLLQTLNLSMLRWVLFSWRSLVSIELAKWGGIRHVPNTHDCRH